MGIGGRKGKLLKLKRGGNGTPHPSRIPPFVFNMYSFGGGLWTGVAVARDKSPKGLRKV